MPKGITPAKLQVDFSQVEDKRGGGGAHVPEGDYLVTAVACELKSKKDDASSKYLNWQLEIVEPTKYKGKRIYHITSLKTEQLWNLRNFLVDLLGEDKVPKKVIDIPLQKIVAAKKNLGVTLEDDEYPAGSGKFKSKVSATFPKADFNPEGAAPDELGDSSNGQSEETDDDDDMEEIDVDDI